MHVSTSDVFGIPRGDELIDETTPYREWGEPYQDTKIEAERWLWQFQRESRLPLSVIYPCWVYGPGDQAFFPGLAAAIDEGVMMFWHRDTRLAWAYIDNLADAIVLASTHPGAVGNGYLVYDERRRPDPRSRVRAHRRDRRQTRPDTPRAVCGRVRRRLARAVGLEDSSACAARRSC